MFEKIAIPQEEPEEHDPISLPSESEIFLSDPAALGLDSIMRTQTWFCEWITPSIDEFFEEEDDEPEFKGVRVQRGGGKRNPPLNEGRRLSNIYKHSQGRRRVALPRGEASRGIYSLPPGSIRG